VGRLEARGDRAHFKAQFATKTRDEWFEILKQTDICAAPVYSLEEALRDPHNLARDMVIEVDHPKLGKVKHVGIGTKLSDTPAQSAAPRPSPASTPRRPRLHRLRRTGNRRLKIAAWWRDAPARRVSSAGSGTEADD